MNPNVVDQKTDAKNQIWYTKKDSKTSIGFTKEFINQIKECWHVVPTITHGLIKESSPLFAIETNDNFFSVRSPTSGSIITFNDKASNFPDQLTADDVICVIDEKEQPVKKKPAVTVTPGRFVDGGVANAPIARDWGALTDALAEQANAMQARQAVPPPITPVRNDEIRHPGEGMDAWVLRVTNQREARARATRNAAAPQPRVRPQFIWDGGLVNALNNNEPDQF